MNLLHLGTRIRGQREKCRLTQAQLANSLTITAQAVSKWERGENAPDIAILRTLAKVLGVSVDWILSGDDRPRETFEATVFCSSIRNFAHRSAQLNPRDVARWINGIFSVATDCVLQFDGVPVKYVGDGFLAYFSERSHAKRALDAASAVSRTLDDHNFLVTLVTGDIYLGAIGHRDYASPDIMGDTVNTAFLLNQWATAQSDARLVCSKSAIADPATCGFPVKPRRFKAKGNETTVDILELAVETQMRG